MLVSEIVRRVREAAGDLAVLQFSNLTVTDWINDAVRECAVENSLLQVRANQNTVISQADYALPTDIFKMHSIWYDGRKLELTTLNQWEEQYADTGATTDTGTPTMAYIYSNILTLYPAPDAVKVLKLNYTKMPTTIQYISTPSEAWTPNTPSIPEAFHNRLVTYCLAQVALQDEDINKYNALMDQFSTGVIDLKSMKDQEEDLYPFISVSNRDSGFDRWEI